MTVRELTLLRVDIVPDVCVMFNPYVDGTTFTANCAVDRMICVAVADVSPYNHTSKRYVEFVPIVGGVAVNVKLLCPFVAMVVDVTPLTRPPPRGSERTCVMVHPAWDGALMFVNPGGMMISNCVDVGIVDPPPVLLMRMEKFTGTPAAMLSKP